MTFLDETRYHYFSLDSDQDLSTADLELNTSDPAVWVLATHTTAPPSAAQFPDPESGLTRYWWRALFGPGQSLALTSTATTVEGHLTAAVEELYPVWTIYDDDPGTTVPHCWPIDTTCLGTGWNAYNADIQEQATTLAVETLRMLTGYRVGGCPVTIRPCREPCADLGTWMTFPVAGGGAPIRGWQPALASGVWVNITCACTYRDCECWPLEQITLPGSAATVTEVKVDGVALDPADYRVDGSRLVRVDGDVWPTCQDLSLPDTAVGTWAVTYTPGPLPGALGARAAGRLAGEFAALCSGGDCALPANVRTVSRQGVVMDLVAENGDLWPGGLTGLRDVDVFIRRWNPHALKTASAVWSPDLRYPRTMT